MGILKRSAVWCVVFLSGISAAYNALADSQVQNSGSVGVEGFYDRYSEPGFAGVRETSGYGSLTGDYEHYWDDVFAGVDGRVSYGRDRYSSDSGTESGAPQWEYDVRGRAGVVVWADDAGTLDTYLGLGLRYYMDEGKGKFTSLGAFSYDRRIAQLYVPVGFSYAANISDDFTLTPVIEYDQLVWGQVNSRLQNGGQYNPEYTGANIFNRQTSGYGARGELMLGEKLNDTTSWQVGPFIRYWNIEDSNVASAGHVEGLEPHNERTQVGMAVKLLW